MPTDEFYVGYLPAAPPGIRRGVRAAIAFLFLAAVSLAAGFASVQHTLAPSVFEFGKERTFEGLLEAAPYPTLLVPRPNPSSGQAPFSRYLLVAAGKRGADSQTAPFSGQSVRLRGSLIYRDAQTMIELTAGSISVLPERTRAAALDPKNLGSFELTGEIVDTKCNFGVMNPGSGKVHRDCAARCLSGGIPPALVTQDLMGAPAVLLLTGPARSLLNKQAFLPYVGEPVRLRGQVLKAGDSLFFALESDSVVPIPESRWSLLPSNKTKF